MSFIQEIKQIKDPALLRKKLGDRFAKNREFFKIIAPNLVNYLLNPPIKYAILADERGVNIVNIQDSSLVYPYDGENHQMIQANETIAQNPFGHSKWEASSGGMDLYEIGKKYKITDIASVGIKNIIENHPLFMPNIGDCHLPSNFLPPTVCYGIGSGIFLELISEKYEAMQSLFIYEPEEDLFAASCYFIDYEELTNKISSKVFAIFVKEAPRNTQIREFFAKQRITASFAKLEMTLYEDERFTHIKEQISLEHVSNTRGWGTFEDEMIGANNHLRNFNKPHIPVLYQPKLTDVPICIVANGASLDSSLEFLKQNKNKMIIFSCGTTLRTLRKHDIKPDFQIEIERLDYLPSVLLEAGLDDIALLGANVLHPQTFAIAKEKYVFFRDFAASSYFEKPKFLLINSSPFVGNAALALALEFSQTIILCGLDVGFKKDSGRHSKDSIYKDEDKIEEDSFLVAPNFNGEEIYANALYNLSRETLEWAINTKSGTTIYNMSNGAKIANTIPTKTLTLPNGKKAPAIRRIKNSFSIENAFENKPKTVEQEMQEYINQVSIALGIDVKNKKDMFMALDIAIVTMEIQYDYIPAAAILLGGSIKHLLFTIFMGIMHIKTDDIGITYKQCIAYVLSFMNQALSEYQYQKAGDKISSILKNIKKDTTK